MAIKIEGAKKFGFEHPSDMFDKLEWEYQQVTQAGFANGREISYHLINFAITAWHLVDWTYPHLLRRGVIEFKDRVDFIRWAKQQCRELAACHAIANACKHFETTKHSEPGIEILAMPGWMSVHNNVPMRHMIAITIDGQIVQLEHFIRGVHKFWLGFLESQGLHSDMGADWTDAEAAQRTT